MTHQDYFDLKVIQQRHLADIRDTQRRLIIFKAINPVLQGWVGKVQGQRLAIACRRALEACPDFSNLAFCSWSIVYHKRDAQLGFYGLDNQSDKPFEIHLFLDCPTNGNKLSQADVEAHSMRIHFLVQHLSHSRNRYARLPEIVPMANKAYHTLVEAKTVIGGSIVI